MSSGLDSIRASYSAMTLANDYVKRGLNAGKVSKESRLAEIEREREEEMRSVIPIDDSRGEVIEPQHSDKYFVSKDSKGKTIRINLLA